MLIIDIWNNKYPRTTAFLANDLPALRQAQPGVWQPFLATTTLSDADATNAVGPAGSDPLLWFSELGLSHGGRFDKDIPKRIELSRDIAEKFETMSADARAQEFMRMVTLHEMCHWAWCRVGKEDHDQAGEAFEAASGHKVDYAWLSNLAPVATPVAALPAAAQAAALKEKVANAAQPASGQVVPVTPGMFSGAMVAAGMPRGIRNNNPGNIRIADPWKGLAEKSEMTEFQRAETAFCVFKEPEWGLRAMAILLQNYQTKHQLFTIRQMIARWAPASDNNDVNGYASFVAAALNVSPDVAVNALDATLLAKMLKAMTRRENGMAPYGPTQYDAAIALI